MSLSERATGRVGAGEAQIGETRHVGLDPPASGHYNRERVERVGATVVARVVVAGGFIWGCMAGCADELGSIGPSSENAAAPANAAAPSLLRDAAALEKALALAIEPLPKPIRALRLRIYPDRLLLQIQAREEPTRVDQYRVKGGEVLGPIAVELTGPGELKDNLFPLQYANLRSISRLVKHAERRAGLREAQALEVSLQRNLPESMDIRFRVEVRGPLGSRRIDARKDGKILGVHLNSRSDSRSDSPTEVPREP